MDSKHGPCRSLAHELPYEILREIFTQCVEQCVKDDVIQPNPKATPMLICQVCATWRAVTLTTPALWADLSFTLNITWKWDGGEHPLVVYSKVERCMEWLRWWKRNLRSMAPYIHVVVNPIEGLEAIPSHQIGRLPAHASLFFFEFLSSAQFLNVGRFYRYLVHQHFKAGSQVELHPNLHTLIISGSRVDNYDTATQYYHFISSVHSSTKLRRLENGHALQLRFQDYMDLRYNWSTLTHLSLSIMNIDILIWYIFMRTLLNLQLGFFLIILQPLDMFPDPETVTLPHLSQLYLTVHSSGGSTVESKYPLTALFKNMHLPALRNLYLYSAADTWYDTTAIAEVHAVLLSTPSITKLSFGEGFLGGQTLKRTGVNSVAAIVTTPISDDVELLSVYAPRLQTLEFYLDGPLRKHGGMVFPERVFGSSRWLNLLSPNSAIRKIRLWTTYLPQVEDGNTDHITSLGEKDDIEILINEIRGYVRPDVTVVHRDFEPMEHRDGASDWLDNWRWRYD